VAGYCVNGVSALMDKVVELQKVTGRIAAYTEFAKQYDVGALGFGSVDGIGYFLGVGGKVADVIVLLCDGYFHKAKIIAGCQLLDAGCLLLVAGCWVLVAGSRLTS
jgi:hypothetical protein